MAAIKSYTDLEQSKKLAEILPNESADMYYGYMEDKACFLPYSDTEVKALCLPCWSLASLLGVLHYYTLQTNTDGTVFVVCDSKKPMISDAYDNPIDACVAMIEKLHELNLL
jgi:hypothetical protein